MSTQVTPMIIRNTLLFVLLMMPMWVHAGGCEDWVARMVSLQGSADQRVNISGKPSNWKVVAGAATFCRDDVLRIGANSRATLELKNDTILRLGQNTTVTFSNIAPDAPSTLNLLEGIAHFISRIKSAFKVITPFVNAGVEGTEFVVAVYPNRSEVTVFEGHVAVTNEYGKLNLTDGQAAVAERGQPPVLKIKIKPRNAVHWALHYPAILQADDALLAGNDSEVSRIVNTSLGELKSGNQYKALELIDSLDSGKMNDNMLVYRASLRLHAGRDDTASKDIDSVLARAPDNADALALASIIALVQNRKDDAGQLAKHAYTLDPERISTALAYSYTLQASLKLDEARATISRLAVSYSDSDLLHSRLAELELMHGDSQAALVAARRAASINPNQARAHTVLGFIYMARIELDLAREAFDKALALDSSDPQALFGSGLLQIRRGNLAKGRRSIEIAASNDPNNAIIRSYLGKAYFEENRNGVARDQYDMAKKLDPNDPTPWLYGAIQKQTENRPIEALHDLEKSIELNDNRAVYRSSFLLDQDRSVRSVNLGNIYRDIGFEQLARNEARKSLEKDPANYSAHRFLADMYQGLPRHEIASTSELLQAQLLQPININPVQPQMADAGIGGVSSLGNTNAGYNENTALFERNGNQLAINAMVGSDSTDAENATFSGVQDALSYSISSYRYNTDGYRPNNDQYHRVTTSFIQYAINPKLNVQAEYKTLDFNSGDVQQQFSEDNFDPTLRNEIDRTTKRIGLNYSHNTNTTFLLSYINQKSNAKNSTVNFFNFFINDDSDGDQVEGQIIYKNPNYNIISGFGYSSQTSNELAYATFGTIFIPIADGESKIKHKNAYLYAPINFRTNHTLTLGLSYDSLEQDSTTKNLASPKVGYVYKQDDLTIRAAAFKTLKRPILQNQTIEQTQIAGFNQFFDDSNGTEATRYGIGLDKRINTQLYIGVEASWRDVTKNIFSGSTVIEQNQDEALHRAYAYWTPNNHLSTSLEYIYDDYKRDYDPTRGSLTRPANLTTHSVPLKINYFFQSGVYATLLTTYVIQDVDFVNGTTLTLDSLDDNFIISDLTLGYRMKNKRGRLSFGIKNLFDTRFEYFNVYHDSVAIFPAPIQYYPDRYIFTNLQLNF